jgi:hypothetical protein
VGGTGGRGLAWARLDCIAPRMHRLEVNRWRAVKVVMHRLDSAARGNLPAKPDSGWLQGLARGRDMSHRQAEPQPQ